MGQAGARNGWRPGRPGGRPGGGGAGGHSLAALCADDSVAANFRSVRAKTAVSCAPFTTYLPFTTNAGTPITPCERTMSLASAVIFARRRRSPAAATAAQPSSPACRVTPKMALSSSAHVHVPSPRAVHPAPFPRMNYAMRASVMASITKSAKMSEGGWPFGRTHRPCVSLCYTRCLRVGGPIGGGRTTSTVSTLTPINLPLQNNRNRRKTTATTRKIKKNEENSRNHSPPKNPLAL